MASRQSNLAYDFDRFETQHRKAAPNVRVVKKAQQARKTRYLVAKTATCVAVYFVGVLGIIMRQVAITEVTMQITQCNQKLELLESDYRTLSAELESSMAMDNIESFVTREKGMSKLREDQVTYVSLSNGDSVDVVESHTTSLLDQLKQTFSGVLSYLKPSENTME